MKSGFFVIVLLFCATCAFSTTIYVPDDYSTIQGAINASTNGDTVIVRQGTYVENIDFLGKGIVVKSEEGPAVTIIDGDLAGSVVSFQSGENNTSILEGFTITNGSGTYFDPYWEYGGGGIFCSSSAPTIRNNIITGNSANNGGGIGAVYNSPIVVTHNIIFDNAANTTPGRIGGGGGIAIAYDSDAEISFNEIYNNFSNKAGGGIAIGFDCNPEVSNNTIRDNVANDYAGGIQIYSYTAGTFESNIIMKNSSLGGNGAGGISCRLGSYPVIANNLIAGNSCATYGGGIRIFDDATPTVKNNIVFGNEADVSGGGIECNSGACATLTNMIIWNNHAPTGTELCIAPRSLSPAVLTISYSDVKWGEDSVYVDTGSTLNWGDGMIDADPLLADVVNEDFHLTWDSPCRDVGDNLVVDDSTDFEGDPRVVLGTVDMGSDEYYYHLYHVGDVVAGSPLDLKVVGYPTAPVTLALGSGIADPPYNTQHGDLWLEWPLLWQGDIGTIQSNGILALTATVPSNWVSGSEHYLQALVGLWGNPWTWLTNLEILVVE